MLVVIFLLGKLQNQTHIINLFEKYNLGIARKNIMQTTRCHLGFLSL